MTREGATHRLLVIWLAFPLPALLLLVAQTVGGKYGEDSAQAWNWLLAQIAPILALVMTSAFSSPSRTWREKPANSFRWKCAAGTSILYAVLILALLLVEPLLGSTPYELFGESGWLLALLQSVVIACIGAVIFDGR